jgi:hypothetical protein
VIEAVGQQRRGLVDAAFHDPHRVGIQRLADAASEHGGGVHRHLRRLQHGAVSGGESADQRREQESDRVVPGCDDQHHTEGLPHDPRAARDRDQSRALGPRPALQILQGQGGLDGHLTQIRRPGLEGRLAQIRVQSLGELVAVLANHAAQALDLLLSPGEGPGVPRVEVGAQVGDEAGYALDVGARDGSKRRIQGDAHGDSHRWRGIGEGDGDRRQSTRRSGSRGPSARLF